MAFGQNWSQCVWLTFAIPEELYYQEKPSQKARNLSTTLNHYGTTTQTPWNPCKPGTHYKKNLGKKKKKTPNKSSSKPNKKPSKKNLQPRLHHQLHHQRHAVIDVRVARKASTGGEPSRRTASGGYRVILKKWEEEVKIARA